MPTRAIQTKQYFKIKNFHTKSFTYVKKPMKFNLAYFQNLYRKAVLFFPAIIFIHLCFPCKEVILKLFPLLDIKYLFVLVYILLNKPALFVRCLPLCSPY